jgi:DNA-binding HxlR family transcriptional regulator
MPGEQKMRERITRLAQRFPRELLKILEALSIDWNRAILLVLRDAGKEGLRFKQIQSALVIPNSHIGHLKFQLKVLMGAALVTHIITRFPPKDEREGKYHLSEIGDSILTHFEQALIPPKKNRKRQR